MRASNILHLGVKELWSLARDPIMLVLIAFAFTVVIYSCATGLPDTLHKAPISIVDEDQSPCRSGSSTPSSRRYLCRRSW